MNRLNSRRKNSLRSFRYQEAERKRCEASIPYGEDYGPMPEPVVYEWTKEREEAFDLGMRRREIRKEDLKRDARAFEPGTKEWGRVRERNWDKAKQEADNTTVVELYTHGMGLRVQRRDEFPSAYAEIRKRVEIEGNLRDLGDGTIEDTRKVKESLHPKKRGKCRGANTIVMARMRDKMYKINRDCLPVMLTLGWPEENTPNPEEAKRCLHAFLTAFDRKYPRAGGFWKLEFGELHGLPHYHLLIWGAQPWKGWCARTWFRICATGNLKHLKAGTRVEKIRSYRGTLAYAGKRYMSKCDGRMPAGDWGRVWGCFNKAKIPWDTPMVVRAPGRCGLWFARIQRRYMKAMTGGKCKTGGRGRVLWKMPDVALQWLRVLEWAETMPEPMYKIEQVNVAWNF